jgi:TatD DNase family protein
MLFDSHAHLDDKRFEGETDAVIARAAAAGVTGILNAGADMDSSKNAMKLARAYPAVYAAVGVHPHDAKLVVNDDYETLAAWTNETKVVAIGEIGLDYFYDHSPKDIQQKVFIRQLDVARQTHKPIIIHDRDAHADLLNIVRNEGRGISGVFHCFSGSLEMAGEVIKLGFYVSIAGPVTFTNAAKLKEVAKEVPLDRLLVETDCPYLTPHPHRGKRNEPALVRLVAEEVARLRGMELEVLAEATTANVKRLFAI